MNPQIQDKLHQLLGRPLPEDDGAPIQAPQVEGERARGALGAGPKSLQALREEMSWGVAESAEAEKLGLELRQGAEGWWAVWDRGGRALEMRGEVHRAQDPNEPALLFVGLREQEPALIQTSRGGALALYMEGGQTRARLCAPHAVAAGLSVDLGPWVAEAQDLWLIEQVRERAAQEDVWEVAVAVGMALRLHLETVQSKRARVAQALAGQPPARDAWGQSWARALGEDARQALGRRADAEAQALQGDLEAIQREALRDDAEDGAQGDGWGGLLARWGRACCRRDALQSVRRVLSLAQGAPWRVRGLADLDELGELLAGALQDAAQPADPLRERAAQNEPAAWWGAP